MGWRLARQPNGKLSSYDSTLKDFTSVDMTDGEAVAMCCDVHLLTPEIARESIDLADKSPTRFDESLVEIEAHHGLKFATERRQRLGG